MSDAKHTKGPWVWSTMSDANGMLMANHSGRPVVLAASRKGMQGATMQVRSRGDVPRLVPIADEPDHPDLALIAAAPDLLAACETLLKNIVLEENWRDDDDYMERARAAIKKAQGET